MSHTYDDLALVFRALAHPVRLHILDLLRGGEICVCQIEAALGKRQAYISQQLMVLREAGLVETRKEGLQVFYRLVSPVTEAVLASVLGERPVPVPLFCSDSRLPAAVAEANVSGGQHT
ncbi:MAG: ArsR family transcriptional regulator [Chloroflexi bacterium]|jgi:ArsR family transcriptional regulator|nr:ArsR family transcriptional regulator [Chloroflexota bacterium]MDL1885396.1 winged helix-turn-helix transcriptional regulator [Anaerolineae bacterium CFX8]